MPYIDIWSLLVISVVLSALMGVSSFVFAQIQGGRRPLRLWGWALLMLAAGQGLIALRGYIPDLAGIVLANTLIFGAAVMMLRCARSFYEEPGADVWGWLTVAAASVLVAYWTYVVPSLVARIFLFSSFFALLLLRVAVHLGRTLPPRGKLPQVFTAAVIALLCASSLARGVLTLRADGVEHLTSPSHLQSLYLLISLIASLAATLGVMWMEIWRLQSELVELATVDALTGCLNRRAFFDAVER